MFAIAITVLVIDLRIPSFGHEPSDAELAAALRALLPRLFAYALSFTVIGIYWHAHWRGFRRLTHVDERLVMLNLLLLAFVVLIPFPTALIGEYGDRPLAVAVYAITLSGAGALGPLAWIHALRRGLVAPAPLPRELRAATARAFALPAVLLGSLVLLPFVPTTVVEVAWFAMVPVQIALARAFR